MMHKNKKISPSRLRLSAVRCVTVTLTALLMVASTAVIADAAVPAGAGLQPQQRGDLALELQFAAYPEVLAQMMRGDFKTALRVMLAYQDGDSTSGAASGSEKYGNDPQYQNLLGMLAQKNGEHAMAAAAFERVVLIDPENAGAWLDLAIASAELGEDKSALDYFSYIENQFEPPAAMRSLIDGLRSDIKRRTMLLGWRFSLQSMAGFDTNANGGLQSSVIFLTLGEQRLGLLLDPEFHARGDSFVQLGGSARSVAALNDAYQLEFAASARQRSYLHENNFSMLDVNASLGLHRRVGDGDASAWLHGSSVMLGGERFMNSTRAALQFEHPLGDCFGGLSGELEARSYARSAALNGDLLWAQGGLACKWKLAGKALQTTMIARIGSDQPSTMRAGGRTLRSELLLQVTLPADDSSRTELTWQMARARDREGYSVLLENNATRSLTRHLLRLAWSKPVALRTELVLAVESNRVLSNLPLFQQTGSTVSIEIRKQF
ncbi:MAG: hypothetical protein ACOH2B_15255 [Burkholderiaceae bacterium]